MPFPRPDWRHYVRDGDDNSVRKIVDLTDRELLDVIAKTERNAALIHDYQIADVEKQWSRVQGEDAERILASDLERLREQTDQEFLLSFPLYGVLLGEAIHRKLVNPDDYEDDSWSYQYESEDDRPFLYRIPSEYP